MQFVELAPLFILLLSVGAVAGILAGLLGVGGGVVLVPAFYYVFASLGYETQYLMQICLATSLATIIITSLRSLRAHSQAHSVDWTILRAMVLGLVVGALLGMWMVQTLHSTALQIIFGAVLICIGVYMSFSRADLRLLPEFPAGGLQHAIATFIGFMSVLMGIGGGSFAVPAMTLCGTKIHRAVATASGFGAIIAIPSVFGFLFVHIPEAASPPFTVGSVNILAFVIVICASLLTAPFGAYVSQRIDPKPLKKLFGVFLICIAFNMLRLALIA